MADALTRISERLFGTADVVRPDLAPTLVAAAPGIEPDISYQDASIDPAPEAAGKIERPHPGPPAPRAQGPAAILKGETPVHNDYDTPSRREPSSSRPRTALRSGDRPGRFEPVSKRPDTFDRMAGGLLPPVVPSPLHRDRRLPESRHEDDVSRDIEPVVPSHATRPPTTARQADPTVEPEYLRSRSIIGPRAGEPPVERPSLVPMRPEKEGAFDLRFDATVDHGTVAQGEIAADESIRDTTGRSGDTIHPAIRTGARTEQRKAQSPFGGQNERNETRSDETERTITITIGRIDVRAVHPPPPPVQSAPRRHTPSLTLDDYLKQHNGGGR